MQELSVAGPVVANPATARAADFLDVVFPPPRSFAIRLWTGETLPSAGPPSFTLVLRNPGSLRRMFKVPVELSMGEAYLHGDFEVEGDMIAAFGLPHTARALAQSPSGAAALTRGWLRLPRGEPGEELQTRGPAHLHGHEHSRERDRAAIQYHYDVGNDFYQLFLDGRMIYSCAYFPTGEEDIDAAQEAKLEHICRKLRLKEGERLLDVGCGWGGLLIYAAQRHGIEGVGVTLSDEQHRLANERIAEAGLEGRLRVEKRDYRDLDEHFDKIVSVGMFEHVGRDHFPEYFTHVFRLLKPGGLFLNHAIAARAKPERSGAGGLVARTLDHLLVGNETFRKRYIFPDGELAPVSVANIQGELAGFEVRDVENLREHYARTLRHWLTRLRQRRDDAMRIAGTHMFRLWEMYLAGSIWHFETARININQTLFAKPDGGDARVPGTRADLYA
ncbi:MAG TPA: cyclopropane-fatty-acyl-phospholipid synthase family protein [Longimicrobiaceae bacterium]|nr:cyclopropane-fatty-acyl-phospholipid synthase family protein [Longimicrobiaceae bacterium]